MALLTLPGHFEVTQVTLALEFARADRESPVSFTRLTRNFTGARWRGTTHLARSSWTHSPDEQRHERALATEAWLRRFSDPLNTVEMPLGRPAATLGAGAVVAGVAGDVVTVGGDAGASAMVGSFLRNAGRTYQVTEVLAGGQWRLSPILTGVIAPAVNSALTGTDTVLARVEPGRVLESIRAGSRFGPWAVNWVEAVA